MPRRSTGCERCRQRRIRCDEQRPNCQNCARQGVKCTGYRPPAEQDLRFVDQSRQFDSKAEIEAHGRPQIGRATDIGPKHFQWRHRFVESMAHKPVQEIGKAPAHRAQLLNTFLGLYLPAERDDSLTSNFGYLVRLSELDISSQLLQTSIDVLCLLEIGALYQDERCLQEGRSGYVKALHMLSRQLARPKAKQVRSDHVLGTITMLALCELFEPLASNNHKRQGWLSHIEGAERYLLWNRDDCMASPFGRLLFHNIRHSSLCMGFAKRRAVPFAQSAWLRTAEESSQVDSFVTLYALAIQIPGLLERVDIFASNPYSAEAQTELCGHVAALRRELTSWLQTYHVANEKAPYEVINVRDMESFAHLCLDRTFQTVFRFRYVQICNQIQVYWICCLILDCTLLDIYHRSRSDNLEDCPLVQDLVNGSEQEIEMEVFVTATNFCRSIPYCCEPGTGSVSRLSSFFLSTVERYFEHYGHCNEAEWCRSVRSIWCATSTTVDRTHDGTHPSARIETAQVKVKHRCKSPICNFKIECCAPAPLLMIGEHPDIEHLLEPS